MVCNEVERSIAICALSSMISRVVLRAHRRVAREGGTARSRAKATVLVAFKPVRVAVEPLLRLSRVAARILRDVTAVAHPLEARRSAVAALHVRPRVPHPAHASREGPTIDQQ
jgi:hypothetical protein